MKLDRAWFLDSAERVCFAFLLTFLGVLLANGTTSLNVSTAHDAAVAGIVAALTVVKSLIASFVPNTVAPASIIKAPSA